MRRLPLLILSVAIVCCLSQQAQAQSAITYGYSDVSYDENSDTVTAYASTEPDYQALYYYTPVVDASVTDSDGNWIGGLYATGYNNSAMASRSWSGTGAAQYNIVATHTLQVNYSGTYYTYYPLIGSSCNGTCYNDYFNFSPNANLGIDVLSYFNFLGRGPQTPIQNRDLVQGRTRDRAVSNPVRFRGVSQQYAPARFTTFSENVFGTYTAVLELPGDSPPCMGTAFDMVVDLEKHSSVTLFGREGGTDITEPQDAQFRLNGGGIKEEAYARPYFEARLARVDASKENRAFTFIATGRTSGGSRFTRRASVTIQCN